MPTLTQPRTAESPTRKPPTTRIVIKATRPALIDLRFKGDPWIDGNEENACLYLGDYAMLQIRVTPFDLPTLNTALQHVRLGQARWQQTLRKLA